MYFRPALTPAGAGRFSYTGQIYIPELGLYHYKARIYSPTLGRFLQTDPIGYEDQMNLYAYVGNDPVNLVDPSGMAKGCVSNTKSRIESCVTFDADFNNDGRNDINSAKIDRIAREFSGFIERNNGADISNSGKLISGDGSIGDKTFTRVVSQFVGASGLAQGWDKIDQIDVSKRDYWRFGTDAYYMANADNPNRGIIYITGSPYGWSDRYLYDSPSNMARALFHETGHTASGLQYEGRVDSIARRNLMESGLGGGGCWGYRKSPTSTLPGC